MNIIIEKSNLLDGLKKVGVYVNNKTIIPVFTGVKVSTVNDNTVELATTNGDTYITTEIHAQVITKGTAVVQHKQIFDFLKKSKATSIELETLNEHKINIKAKNIDYKVISFDCSLFPSPPVTDFTYLTLSFDEYKRIINNTTYALATSDSRPVLKGLNIQADHNNKLHFTATDSHRLARYTVNSDLDNMNVTADGEALKNSLKVTDKSTKEVKLGFNDMHTLVQFDNTKIYVRNIDGNYPDTSRLIPENFKTYATINTVETLESLEMLHTLSKNDRNNVVRMELNGKIELRTNSAEIGEMNALLTGEKDGEDLKISYSNLYMKDALKALNNDEVNLNFVGSMRPFTATAPGIDAVHLILPVRTY